MVSSDAVASTPDSYREYISRAAGEFSCAKGLYVGSQCGWFSDRSACFLAAGRPVVVQDTGIRELLPTGAGLFAVSTVEEAAESKRIRLDYAYTRRPCAGSRWSISTSVGFCPRSQMNGARLTALT